ncbi:hypothetical protein SAMN06297251_14410 [Fulvimarina manganoxydans]|uniref:Uncharacterized protein n=2 Tax=Fulvimarina manganoxydans TaxID=937218 RepID=A0A1W2EZ50_9HYPH|nr:hypothetical protein SAMN06297251_14410 [Fulvimarina manganoxydans]
MTASSSTVWAAAGINLAFTAIVVGITGVVLSNQWSVATTIGEMRTTIASMEKVSTDTSAVVKDIQTRTTSMERQLFAERTSPGQLLASAGINVDQDVGVTMIRGRVVMVPRTQQAAERLSTNFQRVKLLPTVDGYTLDEASVAVVENYISSTASAASALDRPSPYLFEDLDKATPTQATSAGSDTEAASTSSQ